MDVSRLSKQSGDVKNDDVTSGSMSPGRKRPKIRLLEGKSLPNNLKSFIMTSLTFLRQILVD